MKRCRFLDWDSAHFRRRIARLDGERLSQEEWPAIEEWCFHNDVECLYFLADSDCPTTAMVVEQAGFALKDIRFTYQRKVSHASREIVPRIRAEVKARPMRESDLDSLVRIARAAHSDTRFYFDKNFDPADAAHLYDIWIRKACNEDHVIVGEEKGETAGYLTCQRPDANSGCIGLVAVDPRQHGLGIGRAMMDAAIAWFVQQGSTDISTVTQGRNVAAHRFYQSAGFLTRSVKCWYHRWFQRVRLP